jgi:hypothetical protein
VEDFPNGEFAVENWDGMPIVTADVPCPAAVAGDRPSRYLTTHEDAPRPY